MYVLLFFKARNIVFVVIVISHDYSLPLSKLFCLKGSLNLKERRGNFLVVFWESCTFRMVQCNPRSRSVWPHFSAWKYTSRKRKKYCLKTRSTLQLGINYCLKLLVEALRYKLEVRIYDLQWDHCDVFFCMNPRQRNAFDESCWRNFRVCGDLSANITPYLFAILKL